MIVVNVAIAGVLAFALARVMSGGTNIDQREKYWAKEVATAGLKPGASKEDLERFAQAHGEGPLHCYQNGRRNDVCDFGDRDSHGGSRNHPMKLFVVFTMKDGKMASHEFVTGSEKVPE
jgi:hypothetical protein